MNDKGTEAQQLEGEYFRLVARLRSLYQLVRTAESSVDVVRQEISEVASALQEVDRLQRGMTVEDHSRWLMKYDAQHEANDDGAVRYTDQSLNSPWDIYGILDEESKSSLLVAIDYEADDSFIITTEAAVVAVVHGDWSLITNALSDDKKKLLRIVMERWLSDVVDAAGTWGDGRCGR